MLKTLNFYMSYYDRDSPTIILLAPEKEKNMYAQPCYSNGNEFPEIINSQVVDSTLLETILVANSASDVRLKFIFYYQMLEYCSYYHLDSEIKKQLFHILKKPEISYKANEYSKLIIDELQDYFNKNKYDSNKLEKTISYFCGIDDIKFEIKEHQDYFCRDIEFEGGLKISKLFKDSTGIDSMSDTLLNQIRVNIEKIRNVLVHLRESRENKVILPTEYNDGLLAPYLFIIRRIAEKVAMQFE